MEQVLTKPTNRFGQVTNIAVHYNVKKGLFAGISKETLPLRHITAVRLETSRHWVWGILLAILGIVGIVTGNIAGILIGVLLLVWAALLIWGTPKVVVNTAGGDLRPSVSWPWTRAEAEEFVNILRNELLKRG